MGQLWQMMEVVGSSGESIQAAVRNAVMSAGLVQAKWFEVREIRGLISGGGRDVEFQVRVAIGYEKK